MLLKATPTLVVPHLSACNLCLCDICSHSKLQNQMSFLEMLGGLRWGQSNNALPCRDFAMISVARGQFSSWPCGICLLRPNCARVLQVLVFFSVAHYSDFTEAILAWVDIAL